MESKHLGCREINENRKMTDVASSIAFILLMTIYVGVALYAMRNGQIVNSFTYIHNVINDGGNIDSTGKVAIQILADLQQARFMILSLTALAGLWSIATIIIIRQAASLAVYSGITCEVVLFIALFIATILASQSQVYKHSTSKPYLFFPLLIGMVSLKLLALKEVGLQFLSNLVSESCRVIATYWFGFLVTFLIHILALSSIIFGFCIYCQLMSTSLKPLYKEVQTDDGISLEIRNFVIVTIPSYIYLFHMINIVSTIWFNKTVWYFSHVFLSETFVELYKNPEEHCNSVDSVLGKLRTIIRYHMGTIIYAASPYAFIVQISAMWKYAFNATNDSLKQKPFIGSLSWIIAVWNLSDTGLVFCSFHRIAFKQSAKCVGRLFIYNPVRLLSVYAVIGWLSLFVITFVTLATIIVFQILSSLINEPPQTSIAAIVVIFGAIAMTATVCQLLRTAILSIYVFIVQKIEQFSDIENKRPRNPAVEKIITQYHD